MGAEDIPNPFTFFIDIVFYSVLLWLTWTLIQLLRGKERHLEIKMLLPALARRSCRPVRPTRLRAAAADCGKAAGTASIQHDSSAPRPGECRDDGGSWIREPALVILLGLVLLGLTLYISTLSYAVHTYSRARLAERLAARLRRANEDVVTLFSALVHEVERKL